MTKNFYCPRGPGPESPFKPPFNGAAEWDAGGTCSYCGSLHPDELMRRLEAGDVEIDATDKNYKIYVSNVGGTPFNQRWRNCPSGATCTGPDDCTHWESREKQWAKFYFAHLSAEQRTRFIDIYNAGKMKMQGGQGFHVLPYFCRASTQASKH